MKIKEKETYHKKNEMYNKKIKLCIFEIYFEASLNMNVFRFRIIDYGFEIFFYKYFVTKKIFFIV